MSLGQTPEAPLLSSASASNTVTGWCVVVGEMVVCKALSRGGDIAVAYVGWYSGWRVMLGSSVHGAVVGSVHPVVRRTVQQSPCPVRPAARDSMRSA